MSPQKTTSVLFTIKDMMTLPDLLSPSPLMTDAARAATLTCDTPGAICFTRAEVNEVLLKYNPLQVVYYHTSMDDTLPKFQLMHCVNPKVHLYLLSWYRTRLEFFDGLVNIHGLKDYYPMSCTLCRAKRAEIRQLLADKERRCSIPVGWNFDLENHRSLLPEWCFD